MRKSTLSSTRVVGGALYVVRRSGSYTIIDIARSGSNLTPCNLSPFFTSQSVRRANIY
jgi:hypothetical protein